MILFNIKGQKKEKKGEKIFHFLLPSLHLRFGKGREGNGREGKEKKRKRTGVWICLGWVDLIWVGEEGKRKCLNGCSSENSYINTGYCVDY